MRVRWRWLGVAVLAAWAGGCATVPKVRVPRLWGGGEPPAVARYEAAKEFYEEGEYGQAVTALESWLQAYAKTPLEPAALYYLARSQFRADQAEKAQATYKLLAQEYEGTRWAAFAQEDLSHVTAPIPNLPDYRRTRRWWNPVEWLRPKLPVVRDYEAARTHFRKGRYHQAIVGFRTLAERNPKSPLAPAAWYWVARAHEELGEGEKAREVFGQVASRYQGTEWAKHAQEGLRRLKDS